MVSFPENTPVKKHIPRIVTKSEITFFTVIFSLNKNSDINITNIGAV